MSQSESDVQICCATYKAGSIEVKAYLITQIEGVRQHYMILLEQQGECAKCDLGTDLYSARALFFDVVFGGVTACTLQDVVEDRMGTLFVL